MIQNRAYILLTRKLTGEANDSEIRELQSYLEQNPAFENAVSQISSHWNAEQNTDQEFLEATYLLHLERMKAKGVELHPQESGFEEAALRIPYTKKSARKILMLAMPLALIIAFGTWFASSKSAGGIKANTLLQGNNEISTRNGSRSKIQLPDGSVVWLNAGSKLEYGKSFGNELREVQLTGEAFFDVVKNPDKPFIVNTKSARIKVLGTSFNVRSYPDDKKTETSLIKGSVEVTLKKRPDEKWILKPNEKLVLLNDYITPEAKERPLVKKPPAEPVVAIKKLTFQPGESVAVEAAWTYNKLSFEDESFAEVAHKMERWYDLQFEFGNKDLENLMLHGSFTTETIKEAMDALQYSFKFKYEIKEKKVIIFY